VNIDRPICIFGTGRSGTTLLFQLLCSHPRLGWFSNYTNRFPRLPCLSATSRLLENPWIREHMGREWPLTPRPCESYRLYNHLTDAMFAAHRPLSAADATPAVVHKYRRCVSAHLRWQGKQRFIQKHTGYPRANYLSAIFPDARFVSIIRDGRAVASSMLKVPWWDGTMKSWLWEPMDPEYEAEYLASNKEPIVLAAIVWKTLMRRLSEAREQLPRERYLELRYDVLTADARSAIEEVANYCDLEPSAVFDRRVAAVPVRNEDDKWRRELTARQVRLLEYCLQPSLEHYGFAA
jgi:hypothetical protein